MIPEHLAKLERALRASDNIPAATRQELLRLVDGLKAEVSAGDDTEPASQVVEALSASVRQLEATHPHLVEMVNQIALTLSNMGI